MTFRRGVSLGDRVVMTLIGAVILAPVVLLALAWLLLDSIYATAGFVGLSLYLHGLYRLVVSGKEKARRERDTRMNRRTRKGLCDEITSSCSAE